MPNVNVEFIQVPFMTIDAYDLGGNIVNCVLYNKYRVEGRSKTKL